MPTIFEPSAERSYHLIEHPRLAVITPDGEAASCYRVEADEWRRTTSGQILPGDRGGWMDAVSSMGASAWVADEGVVLESTIFGCALVDGHATVFHSALRDSARVTGRAAVRYAEMGDEAFVGGHASLNGANCSEIRLMNHVSVSGEAIVEEAVCLHGDVVVIQGVVPSGSCVSGDNYVEDARRNEGWEYRAPDAPTTRAYPGIAVSPGLVGTPFGIEIECERIGAEAHQGEAAEVMRDEADVRAIESYYSGRNYTVWQVKDDSSLNNGIEAVSPILAWGDQESMRQIQEVCRAVRGLGYRARSTRCGGHVHVDLGSTDPYGLVLAYQWAQEMIDLHFVTPSRVHDTAYAHKLGPNDVQSAKDGSLNWYRSSVLNFSDYARRGTVEFRQRNGTTFAHEWVRWVALVMSLVSLASAFDIDTLEEMAEHPAQTLDELQNTLAGVTDEITHDYLLDSVPAALV